MKIRKIAAIALLVLSSFAADSAAPSKSELEAMYDKAFREFDSNNYEQALKDLDAIDARQPDLAESQNLRGVILMRQKDYPTAEKSLQKALAADPKFWNARFNLAEIPFLEKNWAEARKRFQELLNGNASELQAEATQLIQYKILIAYLMEGKENMVQAMVAKFELSPDTPAVHYANAAIALQKKDAAGAKEALTTAEKNFSPQLNKLFAESLYEVGWLEKPAGETRAALELNSAAERAAKTTAFAKVRFDEAEQALQQRDLTAARKLVDEADAADPNQAPVINLRGEILLEQKEYDAAENDFKKAAKLDPKFRDAQYNLAQVPFKKKEYAKARDRFEALFGTTTGADKDKAAQLIKYKVYLTYLLEGKDARAQKMMEQFQFTGDTPALYYAQAAWEFKHSNPTKANDWVTSARKIYSPALNSVFSDAFYDLGWIQTGGAVEAAAPAVAEAAPAVPEQAPSIEPTPIPSTALAKNEAANPAEPLTSLAQADGVVPGMEATASSASQSPAASSAIGASASPSVETPVASTASPAAARPVIANAAEEPAVSTDNAATTDSSRPPATTIVGASASASPATVLAPAQIRDWAQPTFSERLERFTDRNTLLVGGLLLAGILLLAWVVIPELRRRMMKDTPNQVLVPAGGPSFDEADGVGTAEELIVPTHLAGGPPQVSLQLRASEPALRRAQMPLGRNSRSTQGSGLAGGLIPPPIENFVPPDTTVPLAESTDNGDDEPLSEPTEEVVSFRQTPDEESHSNEAFEESVGEPAVVSAPEEVTSSLDENSIFDETSTDQTQSAAGAAPPELEPVPPAPETFDPFVAGREEAVEPTFVSPAEFFGAAATFTPVYADPRAESESRFAAESEINGTPEPASSPIMSEMNSIPEDSMVDDDPVGQGQPIPYLTPATSEEIPATNFIETTAETVPAELAPVALTGSALAGIGALRHSLESLSALQVHSTEQTAQQPTIPATMPQPTQPIPAPVIRTSPNAPMTGGQPMSPGMQPATAPQSQPHPPGGGMHTAVQLTFSFEIASLQLTPTFKMGALQLKPTSKIVTMRLAPSQHPQPAMNLQVTFEIATMQLEGNAIGMVRLTPSQQQRPGIISSPTFNISGLQLVSGAESASAPVQITPSQQGQASVHVTAPFQIATVEFSPSFEIASIVLNSTSKNVSVQLPDAGPSAVEGAPVFEVSNVQLAGNGEIGMMQLTPQGSSPKQIG
ncbi:MAG: tetratricopeptide repeat protein [Verrucomicrobiota bacterium]|nr:tetratricopeptide repeat protein [Verrucomicrobiota bacterium]